MSTDAVIEDQPVEVKTKKRRVKVARPAKKSVYAIKGAPHCSTHAERKHLHKQKVNLKKAESMRPNRSHKLHRVTTNLGRKHPNYGKHPSEAYNGSV